MRIDNINITGITSDSRQVKQGNVFVAIVGMKKDGNDYIDEAIEKGASIIFTEKNIEQKRVPVKKVSNARKKLAELLNEFYNYPSEKLFLIGVTGTNGKTTTTYLIDTILKESGYNSGVIGTMGIRTNYKHIKSSLTTPKPEVLFKVLNDFVEEGIEIVTMEVSSHGLKFYRTYGLNFDIAVHTNIEKDHMDLHKTMDDYIKTKKMLFNSLGRNKLAIINTDDKKATKLIEGNNRVIVLTYGMNSKATITSSSLVMENHTRFNVCMQRGLTTRQGFEIEPFEFSITVNILGRHNIYNILASIAVALYLGIDTKSIQNGLIKFIGVRRRLEKIYNEDFTVIDDFCHNPSSYEAVFETVQSLDYNNLIIINSIRGNRGIEINQDNARTISTWMSLLGNVSLILSLSQDVVDEKDKVDKNEILAYTNILEYKEIPYDICDTLSDSINNALNIVKKRDLILLLGAQGMDRGRKIFTGLIKMCIK